MPKSIDSTVCDNTTEFTFGPYLRSVRQTKKISIRQLAKKVNITPTYLSDIEKENNNPPNNNLLEKIINELQIDTLSPVRSELYDLAAKKRGDVPADVKDYIINNDDLLKVIRLVQNKPDENYWKKALKSLK